MIIKIEKSAKYVNYVSNFDKFVSLVRYTNIKSIQQNIIKFIYLNVVMKWK